ncbi:MAG: hypothetical protein WD266_01110 [Balneolales bacterium]
MEAFKVVSMVLLTMVLAGCTFFKNTSTENEELPVVPKATSAIMDGSNLNAYNRVFIPPLQYDGGVLDQYGVTADVERKLKELGFQSISEEDAEGQSPEEAARTLYCLIEHQHAEDGKGGLYVIMQINMYDHYQQIIYSGRGHYQGLSTLGDLRGATDYAMEGFIIRYEVYDPTVNS